MRRRNQLPDVNELLSEQLLENFQLTVEISRSGSSSHILYFAFREVNCNPIWKQVLKQEYESFRKCALQVEDKEINDLIINCAEHKDFGKLFASPFLRSTEEAIWADNVAESYNATERSWEEDFVGDGADTLFEYMCLNFPKSSYARYCPITQSSGMGKSRLVDELSKKHLVIPICLQSESEQGFPPPDRKVRNFLLGAASEDQAYQRALIFLTAVGYELREWLNKQSSEQSETGTASAFRSYMTDGMTSTSHNESRIDFYANVVERARGMSPVPAALDRERRSTFVINDALARDASAILEEVVVKLQSSKDVADEQPTLIFAFDEAHVLTQRSYAPPFTCFTELRRALRIIRLTSIFSLFLSTAGPLFNIRVSTDLDPSSRVQNDVLELPCPFNETGFDMFTKRVLSHNPLTLEAFSSIDSIVSFGRPLFYTRFLHGSDTVKQEIIQFAAHKLLGAAPNANIELGEAQKLACLSVRLALDFRPGNPYPEVELAQIEHHLRVCIGVNGTFDRLVSAASSEPILAEASAELMSLGIFDPVVALSSEFYQPHIERSPRGEIVVALMQLLVRDKILTSEEKLAAFSPHRNRITKVVDFLKEFFTDSDTVENAAPSYMDPALSAKLCSGNAIDPLQIRPAKRFSEMFANSRIYFSHFVKITESRMLSQSVLLALATRGASVLCGNCMPGVDIITPFLIDGTDLKEENVSVILWRCVNDRKYGATVNNMLFDAMDPYSLCIFGLPDSPPVIRIVTSLATPGADLKAQEMFGLINPTDTKGISRFPYTSYDFWAHGFDAELYRALSYSLVKPDHPDYAPSPSTEWHTLLDSLTPRALFPHRPTWTAMGMIGLEQ